MIAFKKQEHSDDEEEEEYVSNVLILVVVAHAVATELVIFNLTLCVIRLFPSLGNTCLNYNGLD